MKKKKWRDTQVKIGEFRSDHNQLNSDCKPNIDLVKL